MNRAKRHKLRQKLSDKAEDSQRYIAVYRWAGRCKEAFGQIAQICGRIGSLAITTGTSELDVAELCYEEAKRLQGIKLYLGAAPTENAQREVRELFRLMEKGLSLGSVGKLEESGPYIQQAAERCPAIDRLVAEELKKVQR